MHGRDLSKRSLSSCSDSRDLLLCLRMDSLICGCGCLCRCFSQILWIQLRSSQYAHVVKVGNWKGESNIAYPVPRMGKIIEKVLISVAFSELKVSFWASSNCIKHME
ncbi:hypothetical protein S83_036337 [Arachis hypogaea]